MDPPRTGPWYAAQATTGPSDLSFGEAPPLEVFEETVNQANIALYDHPPLDTFGTVSAGPTGSDVPPAQLGDRYYPQRPAPTPHAFSEPRIPSASRGYSDDVYTAEMRSLSLMPAGQEQYFRTGRTRRRLQADSTVYSPSRSPTKMARVGKTTAGGNFIGSTASVQSGRPYRYVESVNSYEALEIVPMSGPSSAPTSVPSSVPTSVPAPTAAPTAASASAPAPASASRLAPISAPASASMAMSSAEFGNSDYRSAPATVPVSGHRKGKSMDGYLDVGLGISSPFEMSSGLPRDRTSERSSDVPPRNSYSRHKASSSLSLSSDFSGNSGVANTYLDHQSLAVFSGGGIRKPNVPNVKRRDSQSSQLSTGSNIALPRDNYASSFSPTTSRFSYQEPRSRPNSQFLDGLETVSNSSSSINSSKSGIGIGNSIGGTYTDMGSLSLEYPIVNQILPDSRDSNRTSDQNFLSNEPESILATSTTSPLLEDMHSGMSKFQVSIGGSKPVSHEKIQESPKPKGPTAIFKEPIVYREGSFSPRRTAPSGGSAVGQLSNHNRSSSAGQTQWKNFDLRMPPISGAGKRVVTDSVFGSGGETRDGNNSVAKMEMKIKIMNPGSPRRRGK